jgi:hypothetical protein
MCSWFERDIGQTFRSYGAVASFWNRLRYKHPARLERRGNPPAALFYKVLDTAAAVRYYPAHGLNPPGYPTKRRAARAS